jgi:hypothetical protein
MSAETTPIQKGPTDHDVLQADRGHSVLFLSMRDQPSVTGKAMRRETASMETSLTCSGALTLIAGFRSLFFATSFRNARPPVPND